MKITKEMMISEIIRNETMLKILMSHGMGCAICMELADETLEKGARMHNLDLNRLLAELNAAATH